MPSPKEFIDLLKKISLACGESKERVAGHVDPTYSVSYNVDFFLEYGFGPSDKSRSIPPDVEVANVKMVDCMWGTNLSIRSKHLNIDAYLDHMLGSSDSVPFWANISIDNKAHSPPFKPFSPPNPRPEDPSNIPQATEVGSLSWDDATKMLESVLHRLIFDGEWGLRSAGVPFDMRYSRHL
jgi:hypothetical protein